MRVPLVLALLVTVTTATVAVADAGQRRAQAVETDRAFSGPGWRYRDVENFREQFFRDQQRFRPDQRTIVVTPSVVVVSPGRCWQAGYWSYQWVPQSYTYSAWVPAQWTPDGRWIEGHYQPAWYNGGYYQLLWVEGYWASC